MLSSQMIHKNSDQITKTPIKLEFATDLEYTSRNKMPKVPSTLYSKKVIQGQR